MELVMKYPELLVCWDTYFGVNCDEFPNKTIVNGYIMSCMNYEFCTVKCESFF